MKYCFEEENKTHKSDFILLDLNLGPVQIPQEFLSFSKPIFYLTDMTSSEAIYLTLVLCLTGNCSSMCWFCCPC